MFDFLGDIFQSPAGIGDVSATSPRPAGDQGDWDVVAATSPASLGDVTEMSPRPAGDWKKSQKKKNRTCWISRDSPETRLVSMRRRGDVSSTSGDSSRQLVSRPIGPQLPETSPQLWRRRDVPATCGRIGCHLWRRLREIALVRAQANFWSPESPELPRLISRGSRGDVSASEIGP